MGRGRRAALAGAVGVLTLTALGCGAQERKNDPRPQVASRVSVTIAKNGVTVQPRAIGVGPDKYQQIPQNKDQSQPPIRTTAPQTVVFVVANQTGTDSRLEIDGPKSVDSGPMVADSPGSFQTDLPTGIYTIRAANRPGAAATARFAVGPYRASSENDVLLP